MCTMDDRILLAKQQLLAVQDRLCSLYPGLISVGSPFYIYKRSRLATRLKFNTGAARCSTVSKLLLEASLGRCLVGEETCDHIDGNPLNDSLTNLQVLSVSENSRKGPSPSVKLRAIEESKRNRTGVPRPDLCGSFNWASKLTDAQVREIRVKTTSYVRGLDKKIALEYGVSREEISAIRHGRVRKTLSGPYQKRVKHVSNSVSTRLPKCSKVKTLKIKSPREPHYCLQCGAPVMRKRFKYCSSVCSHLAQRKVERPSLDIIQQHIDAGLPMTKIGAMYGVSDNAVRKWLVNRT